MAAGAAQPGTVPGLDDLCGQGGRKASRHPGVPSGSSRGVGPSITTAATCENAACCTPELKAHRPDTEYPCGVGTRSTRWHDDAGGGAVRAPADQLPRHVGIQPREERAAVSDQSGPACRPVGAAQLLDHIDDGERVELQAPESSRQPQREQARLLHAGSKIGWHGAQLVSLRRPPGNVRRERPSRGKRSGSYVRITHELRLQIRPLHVTALPATSRIHALPPAPHRQC